MIIIRKMFWEKFQLQEHMYGNKTESLIIHKFIMNSSEAKGQFLLICILIIFALERLIVFFWELIYLYLYIIFTHVLTITIIKNEFMLLFTKILLKCMSHKYNARPRHATCVSVSATLTNRKCKRIDIQNIEQKLTFIKYNSLLNYDDLNPYEML